MRAAGDREPPRYIWFDLSEALDLLTVMEDARDALIDTGRLGLVINIEAHLRRLARKLELDDLAGGDDGS